MAFNSPVPVSNNDMWLDRKWAGRFHGRERPGDYYSASERLAGTIFGPGLDAFEWLLPQLPDQTHLQDYVTDFVNQKPWGHYGDSRAQRVRQRENDHTDLLSNTKNNKNMPNERKRARRRFKRLSRRIRGAVVPAGTRRGPSRPPGYKKRNPPAFRTMGKKQFATMVAQHSRVSANNRNRSRVGSSRAAAIPSSIAYVTKLGTSIRPKISNDGDLANVPLDIWDDQLSALYPTAASAVNFFGLGSTVTDMDNIYPLALWSQFYNVSPLNSYLNYSEWTCDNWSLGYVPSIPLNFTQGELLVISPRDWELLYNKGLTFQQAAGVSLIRTSFADGGIYSMMDYQGAFTPGYFGTGTNSAFIIKQWSEARPKQYSPFERFQHRLNSKKKWFRNVTPRGGNTNGPYDWSEIDETEGALCVGGGVAIYGTMTDTFTTSTNYYCRKIGDFYLHARFKFRGIGTPQPLSDPSSRARKYGLSKAVSKMIRDEFKYFCQNYTDEKGLKFDQKKVDKAFSKPLSHLSAEEEYETLGELAEGERPSDGVERKLMPPHLAQFHPGRGPVNFSGGVTTLPTIPASVGSRGVSPARSK